MRLYPLSWLICIGISACAGSGAAGAPPARSAEPDLAPPRSPQALADATVYDANGRSKSCGLPQDNCPEVDSNPEFLDKCRLAGYQVRRCGCEMVCSGNVRVSKPHYDAAGNEQPCQPPDPDCTPAETSAAFQDACTAAHHRLVICGCEWLCDGLPKQ